MRQGRVKARRTRVVRALRRFWVLGWFVLVRGSTVLAQQSPLEIGSRRELFLDQYLIEKLDHARLQLHEPWDEGTVLYTSQTRSYFGAPRLYVAIAARFVPGRQAISDGEVAALHVADGYHTDLYAIRFASESRPEIEIRTAS